MVNYDGIPKKRRLYLDGEGRTVPLDKRSGASHYFMVATSGTLLSDGHLTVSGAHFKPDSVVTASYNTTASGTTSIGITLADGTATFWGDKSTDFYYILVNQTL